MANLAMKQLREMKDWLQDRSEAALDMTEKLHMLAMHKPIAALEKINVIAGPVHLLDRAQNGISQQAFRSLRAWNRFNVRCASYAIDRLEARAETLRR